MKPLYQLQPIHWIGWLLTLSLLLLGSGCAWLDAKQRTIIYRPTAASPVDFTGFRAGDERYFVDVPTPEQNSEQKALANNSETTAPAKQQIEIWWLPHPDARAPTLLYYHGTFRHLYQNLPKIDALRQAGFSIVAVEYRGWGRSSVIVPSEQSIMQDALIGFEELRRRQPIAGQRVLYGHSMGSGVAVQVASRLKAGADYGGVILESALTSFPEVAKQASWLGGLLSSLNSERFDSYKVISQVTAPLLMLHGARDTTVPAVLGQRLFEAANSPKEFVMFPDGRHSNLHSIDESAYQNALIKFKQTYLLER